MHFCSWQHAMRALDWVRDSVHLHMCLHIEERNRKRLGIMKSSTRKTILWISIFIAAAALAAIIVSIVIDSTRLLNFAIGINILIQIVLRIILQGTKGSKKDLTKENQEKIQKENDDMTVINMNMHNM